jgi:hypothetical protein
MGRVAKYKKIKSFDPFSKKKKKTNNHTASSESGDVIWGLGDTGRKVKQRSRTAERLHAKKNKSKKNLQQQQQQQQQRRRPSREDGKEERNDGFDLPPSSDQDEFDLADLMGSVTKQVNTNGMLLDTEPVTDIMVATGPAASAAISSNVVQEKDMPASNSSHETTNVAFSSSTSSSSSKMGNTAELAAATTTSTGWNKNNIDDDTKVARLLKLDQQVLLPTTNQSWAASSSSLLRLPGESKRAYHKRTKVETRNVILQSTMTTLQRNTEKLQKKKEFLNLKKKHPKNKQGRKRSFNDSDMTEYNDVDVEGDGDYLDNDDPVRFGEQAERPPTFRQLPRGAQSKKKNKFQQNALPAHNHHQHQHHQNTESSKTVSAKEMELFQRKVQAQYAAVRVKRRQAGEGFHL